MLLVKLLVMSAFLTGEVVIQLLSTVQCMSLIATTSIHIVSSTLFFNDVLSLVNSGHL